MTVIKHKRGSGAPDPSGLDVGELAIDLAGATLYTKIGGSIVELGGGDGTGAGMVISATEPTDKITGMQWMDSTTAIVWVWDDEKWLEFPAGKGGSEGGVTYTLPVSVRGGDIQLPLNEDSTKLIVDTRGGPVELPLMAA
jgi:hypothetical protein